MSHFKKGVAVLSATLMLAGAAAASANVPDEDLTPGPARQGQFVVHGFVVKDELMIAKIAGHQARDAALQGG